MASRWAGRLLAVGLVGAMLVLVPGVANAGHVKIKASCTGGCHWAPSFVRVAKGTKIIWKNPTTVFHDVKSYKGHWLRKRNLPPGTRTHKRLRRHGVYFFRCTIHSTLVNGVCSGMCGKIRVRRG